MTMQLLEITCILVKIISSTWPPKQELCCDSGSRAKIVLLKSVVQEQGGQGLSVWLIHPVFMVSVTLLFDPIPPLPPFVIAIDL